MMDNGCSKVVEATVSVAEPGAREVPQQVAAHVQPGHRELNERVHLRPGVLRPAEPEQRELD